MSNVPSATTWGSPAAPKHALLIHALTSSSHSWHRVAISLASKGYFVTAPNIIGHASRVAGDSDYRLSAIADDLRPYFEARDYSLIIGYAIGGLAALDLFSRCPPSSPTALVMIEPPMHLSQAQVQLFDEMLCDVCTNVQPADDLRRENPQWTREDAIYRELALRLCSVESLHAAFEQNMPWFFWNRLETPSASLRVKVLTADPAIFDQFAFEEYKRLPHVQTVAISGAGHWVYIDDPETVVDEAVKTVDGWNGDDKQLDREATD